MSDYIYIDGLGTIDPDSGEIIDAASIDDPLAFAVRKRDEAKRQENEWEAYRKALDAVILRRQQEKRVAYGDVVCDLRSGTYTTTDADKFAEALYDGPALELETIYEIIAAATGFKRDLLPERARQAYDDATMTHTKRPWIQTSTARKQAPAMQHVAVEMVEA